MSSVPSLAIWGSDVSSLGKDGEGTRVPSPCNSHGLKVQPLFSTLGKGKNTARKAGKKTGNSNSAMVTRRGRIDGGGEPFQDVDLWDAVSPLLISVSADGGYRDHPHLSPPNIRSSREAGQGFPVSFFLNWFPSAADPQQQVTSAHAQFGCPSWHPPSLASPRCSWKPSGLSPASLS